MRMILTTLTNSMAMEFPFGLQESFLIFEPKIQLITVILVTLISFFAGYFKFKIPSLQGKKLPPGSLGFPLFGESISFIKAQRQDKTNEWIRKRINKYGPIFKTSLMGSKAVVLTGQAGNRFMFSGSDNGIGSSQVATVANILGKYSIFELSGSQHKLVRGAVMNILKPESIQRFVGEMDSLVQQQIFQELDGKESIQIVTLMKKITFKVTCSLLFGIPEGRDKDALLEDFIDAIKGLWAIPLNIPGTVYCRALRARGRIVKLLSILTNKKKKQLEEGIVGSNDDIISSLLIIRDENGKPLSEEVLIDNLISLVIASHDTISVLLSLFIRHVARDADIHSKVLEEQMEVAKARKGSEGKLTWTEIQMMSYTWRVAQEIMRLTPPVSGNFKCASRDTSFDGFHIPKGWQVFWVAAGTHMDKNIFDNPGKFDPGRFEGSSKQLPSYTYLPFGAGPRICPGVEFARIEVLLIIHYMITNYRWTEMIPDEPITRQPMPYPAMGLPIMLHQRKSQ